MHAYSAAIYSFPRVIALVGLLALPLVHAATAGEAATPPVSAAEFMEATGLDRTFEQFGPGIASWPRKSGWTNQGPLIEAWEATAATMFDPNAMTAALRDVLSAYEVSAADQQAYDEFYGSSLGKRIVELENALSSLSPEAARVSVEGGKGILAALPSRRASQYDRLWDATGEGSIVLAKDMYRGAVLTTAMLSMGRARALACGSEIDAYVEAMMPQLLAAVREEQLASFAFAYQGLTDDELERYLEFVASPAAEDYYAISVPALGQVIRTEMLRFAEELTARQPRAAA